MKRSLLKYFAWISLILVASASCRSSRILPSGEQADKISESFFPGSFEKITFKAKILYQERELAGLMLIKNAGHGEFKIAFFNELGMTYVEGTFKSLSKHKNLLVKNIAPILDHKLFVKNLEKSLELIFTDKTNPRFQASPPPCPHASMPPCPHASMSPEKDENILIVQLRNGFRLELSPQK